MKTPSKRDLVIFATCAFVGSAVVFGAVYYKKHVTQMAQMSLTSPNVAVAVPPPPKPKATYSLKNQQSPFASRSETLAPIPRSLNVPVPMVPSISVSTAPEVKRATQSEQAATGRSGLHVESVFLGQGGKNMAILSSGKDSVTVREGQSSKFGYISGISKEGLYADGAFISVSKEVSAPPVSSPNRAAGPTALPPIPVEAPAVEKPQGEQQQPPVVQPVQNSKPNTTSNSKNRSES